MRRKLLIISSAAIVSSLLLLGTASAYWVWTPETKKFINPKYAVKDSPKEQFDWAMNFYDAKDYERAAFEFDKLTKNYEYSEYAAKAQYHVGLCYESEGKYYLAFQNYQKAIDNFPHIDNIDEIVAREFNIGHIFSQKENPKVLGTDIMTSFDRAIEIYKRVVENAPFGKIADQAQFKLGETMKTAGRYDEATVVFQKFVEDYSNSPLAEKARYEVANCAYRASLQPAYDAASTDKAIKAFEEFTEANKDTQLSKEADQTIQRLKDKAAEKSMMTAEFYERTQHYDSAVVYYKDVLERFPGSTMAPVAKKRIEEIQAKKVPVERKNWLAWPGSDKKADKKAEKKAEGVVATQEGAAAAPAKKQKAKGWFPTLFGKKEVKAPAAPVVKAPPPTAKKGWLPWFGKGKTGKMAGEKKEEVVSPPTPMPITVEEKREEAPQITTPPASVAVEAPQVTTQTAPAAAEKVEEKAGEAVPQPAPIAPATVEEKIEAAVPPAPAVVVSEPPPARAEKIEEPAPAVAQKTQAGPTSVKVYFEEKPAEKLVPRPVEPPRDVVKTGWVPFTFEKKAVVKETVKEAKETGQKKDQDSGWFPFTFNKKSKGSKDAPVKPAAPQPGKDSGKPVRKGWLPFEFSKKEESPIAPAPVRAVQEPSESAQPAAKKGFFPLAFDKKEESPKDVPVKPAAQPKKDIGKPARKGWLPFVFGGKEEGQKEQSKSTQEPVKKGWAPLNFEKTGTSGGGSGKNE